MYSVGTVTSARLCRVYASQPIRCRREQRRVSEENHKSSYLLAADRLEEWAAELPRWHPGSNELWHEFLDRLYEADRALAARLRRLPTCELWMCPTRTAIELSLGGIRIRSEKGLAAACRIWAAEVRAQLGS